jgi:hypothetical protein
MTLPTDSNGWANFITPILIGAYIAMDRVSVWRAARSRKIIGKTIDEVHGLVNGRSKADADKIAYLSQRIYEMTGNPSDGAQVVDAKVVVKDLKASAEAVAARLKADQAPYEEPHPIA